MYGTEEVVGNLEVLEEIRGVGNVFAGEFGLLICLDFRAIVRVHVVKERLNGNAQGNIRVQEEWETWALLAYIIAS